jgi:membrane protease YdiL (CAAX protease family)
VSPVARALLGYAVAVVAVVLASAAAGLLLLELYPAALAEHTITSLPGLLAGGIASSAALTLVALVAARQSPRRGLGLVRPQVSRGTLVTMVVGTLALGQALESIAHLLGLGAAGTPDVIRRALVGVSAGQLALAVLVIGGLAGFAEELFFRGYMQTQLRAEWGAGRAIVVTGAGFGALHLDWMHAAVALVLGAYLGLVRERSRSTLAAALCHMVNNAASVILIGAGRLPSRPAVHGALLVSSTAVFLLSLAVLRGAGRPGRSCAPIETLTGR